MLCTNVTLGNCSVDSTYLTGNGMKVTLEARESKAKEHRKEARHCVKN